MSEVEKKTKNLIRLCICCYFLNTKLHQVAKWCAGPSVLAGLGVLVVLIPVNCLILNKSKWLQTKQMKEKDERVKLMNEILSGIKVVDIYIFDTCSERINLF